MRNLIGIVLVGALLCSDRLAAEQEPAALRGMQQSLERIVELLELQMSNQRTSLLLERLNIETRALSELESSLRAARSEVGELRSRVESLEVDIEEWQDQILSDPELTYDQTQARIEEELGSSKGESSRLQRLLEARLREVARLESQVARQRVESEAFKSAIDQLLELDR